MIESLTAPVCMSKYPWTSSCCAHWSVNIFILHSLDTYSFIHLFTRVMVEGGVTHISFLRQRFLPDPSMLYTAASLIPKASRYHFSWDDTRVGSCFCFHIVLLYYHQNLWKTHLKYMQYHSTVTIFTCILLYFISVFNQNNLGHGALYKTFDHLQFTVESRIAVRLLGTNSPADMIRLITSSADQQNMKQQQIW